MARASPRPAPGSSAAATRAAPRSGAPARRRCSRSQRASASAVGPLGGAADERGALEQLAVDVLPGLHLLAQAARQEAKVSTQASTVYS